MSNNPVSMPRIALWVPGSLIDRVDRFAAQAGFASRSSAVRALIDAGLSVEPGPGPEHDPRVIEMYASRREQAAG
jgi:metal-responsive CopG/Arc/MetJ family transcriptional regulator